MIKTYVKIGGHWVRIYELNDWWDAVCWCCAGSLIVFASFLVYWNA